MKQQTSETKIAGEAEQISITYDCSQTSSIPQMGVELEKSSDSEHQLRQRARIRLLVDVCEVGLNGLPAQVQLFGCLRSVGSQ